MNIDLQYFKIGEFYFINWKIAIYKDNGLANDKKVSLVLGSGAVNSKISKHTTSNDSAMLMRPVANSKIIERIYIKINWDGIWTSLPLSIA